MYQKKGKLLLLVIGIFFVASFVSVQAKNKLIPIGITQIASHPGIDAIRNGFLAEMKRLGYEEGVNVKYEQTNANGDMSTAQSIAQKYVNDKKDIIFAITTPSSQTCAKAIKGTNIPLIFGAVTDPVSAGLIV